MMCNFETSSGVNALPYLLIVFFLFVSGLPSQMKAQQGKTHVSGILQATQPVSSSHFNAVSDRNKRFTADIPSIQNTIDEAIRDTVPKPRKVMLRSLMLPGWGQYINRQAWKIPLVYGLIGGVAYYAYYADTRYEGYRAAFYNSFDENEDFRFGPTPSWISPNASTDFLRSSRNFYRNRRDLLIIATVLSYALNVLDAYIFAHMRDFDVSDDLSFRPSFNQAVTVPKRSAVSMPALSATLSVRF
jgi:hypothetical protein